MIIRNIEICPYCGQWMPWRKVSSRVVNGCRRIYVRCKRCGHPETVEYRKAWSAQQAQATERGTN